MCLNEFVVFQVFHVENEIWEFVKFHNLFLIASRSESIRGILIEKIIIPIGINNIF